MNCPTKLKSSRESAENFQPAAISVQTSQRYGLASAYARAGYALPGLPGVRPTSTSSAGGEQQASASVLLPVWMRAHLDHV